MKTNLKFENAEKGIFPQKLTLSLWEYWTLMKATCTDFLREVGLQQKYNQIPTQIKKYRDKLEN
jgi:hypothetical protein